MEKTGESETRSTTRRLPIWQIIVVVVILIYFLTGIYVVGTDERGVVRRFGKIRVSKVLPGMHYSLPWPFEKVDTPLTSRVRPISVGFRIVDQVSGIPPLPEETEFLTGDTNIIDIQMIVQYVINEPGDYLFKTEAPDWLVRKAAESVLTDVIGSMHVDDILTRGKITVQNITVEETQKILDQYKVGIELLSANLKVVEPPPEVVESFKDVTNAKADLERYVNEAHGYTNDILPKARGAAEEIRRKAESYRDDVVNRAKGDAARFIQLLKEYRKAKFVTVTRLYLETLEKVLPQMNVYVVDASDAEEPVSIRFMEPKQ